MHPRKEDALFSCKKYGAYRPFDVRRVEQEPVLHTGFRDGNVPAGHERLRVCEEALDMLPEGAYLRSDTAGYRHDLLRYRGKGENERFGRIGFAAGCDVTKEFTKAVAEGR